MKGFGGGGVLDISGRRVEGLEMGECSTPDARFDASQYAFFEKGVVEVDLAGLEDEGNQDVSLNERNQDAEGFGSASDDLASTFARLNRTVSGPRNAGVIGDRTFSRESSSTVDLSQDADFSPWLDRQVLDVENVQEGKRWWSQPHLSSSHLRDSRALHRTSSSPQQLKDSRPLYRTSSYPEQPTDSWPLHQTSSSLQQPTDSWPLYTTPSSHQRPTDSWLLYQTSSSHQHLRDYGSLYQTLSSPQQLQPPLSQNNYSDSVFVPKSPFIPCSMSGGIQASPPYVPFSSSNPPSLGTSYIPLARNHQGSLYGGSMNQFNTAALMNNLEQNSWPNQTSPFLAEQSNLPPTFISQAAVLRNSMILSQEQNPRLHRAQSSPSYPTYMQSQLFSPRSSPPQSMNNFNRMGITDSRDQGIKVIKPLQRGRRNRSSQQSSDNGSQRSDHGWLKFRSKYMSSEEIESILKMQHSSTHNHGSYVDDYYHQACLAKKASGAKTKSHFYPASLPHELPIHSRTNKERHASLPGKVLGKVPFSSICKSQPPVEIDKLSSTSDPDKKPTMKSLEQEPMFAARIVIEDGASFLLDVDDIDRLIHFSQPQDGGSQLRRRRLLLLEGFATLLQLVDPFEPGKGGHGSGLEAKDDLVFLRVVSLPKGRKLLARFIQLIFPGSDLNRVVCIAIFRHLRFIFGGLSPDPSAAETTRDLAKTVSESVQSMTLTALGACLAAVVCSSEQPPLRPFKSFAGDGASIIIHSILERATELLKNPISAVNYSISSRKFWQASFDAFFELLTKYTGSKYDSMMQALLLQTPNNNMIGPEETEAIRREMPVELLRASLPHIDDHQRSLLLNFAGFVGRTGSGQIISEHARS